MSAESAKHDHRERLHSRGVLFECFTIAWNVVEAIVAVGAGLVAGSTALIAFGVDSSIEVIAASALLWRLRRAGAHAGARERGLAESKALYVVAGTFFLLAAYVMYEGVSALLSREAPDASTVGLVLSILSLLIMPALAYLKQKTGRELGSKALQADAVETWVCSYLSLTLLIGVGLNFALGWWWVDAAAALLMLPVIVWQGWETFKDARGEGKEEE